MHKGPRLLTALAASGSVKPIGYGRNGRPIWPVRGGSSDDDSGASWNKDKETDSEDDKEKVEDETKDSEDDKEKEESDSDKDKDKSKTVSQEDYDALKRRMQAADKRATDNEKRIKEFEDREKTDLQKASEQAEELQTENKTLKEQLQQERIANAFLSSNTYTWHDPEDALNALDVSQIEIDDDGKVDKKSLKAQIKALAEKKPHWIKTEVQDSGEPGPGRSNNAKDEKAKRNKLIEKYPALANK